jgi:hypothetical protein
MARTSQIRFGSIGKENNLGKVKINAAKDIMAFDYLDWDHGQTEYLAVPLPADDNKMAFGGAPMMFAVIKSRTPCQILP